MVAFARTGRYNEKLEVDKEKLWFIIYSLLILKHSMLLDET